MSVEETSALCMKKKNQAQQACRGAAAAAEAAARQSEATAKTKVAAAARAKTPTKIPLSAKEEGKARFVEA